MGQFEGMKDCLSALAEKVEGLLLFKMLEGLKMLLLLLTTN